ncbi:hypothetical protein JF66_10600 [Cryobacterium sp. MLB-32]|uniref:phage tail protein n=1 Tax=Cryobacterium sp. MLB-32 TaxID=1529318 RepID=UPI0004E6B81F|nr:phage tail protein [Cryobacterium sp. MLB-32]KFF59532.1 hypothetical protein JF66_10600 [Cryobacterium sp. MLB-32]
MPEQNQPDALLLGILPEVFQVSAARSAPLRALIGVTADLQQPVLDVLDAVETIVHPYRAPDQLVTYLASWVDLDWLTGMTPGQGSGVEAARQRDLVANAADLSARRGTPAGLVRFLQLATGVGGFAVDDDPGVFHVVVHVPADAADRVDLVQRIVAVMKPAHITHALSVDSVPSTVTGGNDDERQ